APVPSAGAGPARPPPPSGRVRVEVLNATTTRGLAKNATDVLRDRGFDVVQTGNARGFSQDASLVLDRVGNRAMADQVAAALGIARVETRRDTTLVLDVTVVLGKDWRAPAAQR
ncbi:MAG TPA: LytR C-terminal domain-containing protein, partial [Longimicrobium sp.]|nr:LytR C-terminal domain-containing protein [Longimicrobium sp.]